MPTDRLVERVPDPRNPKQILEDTLRYLCHHDEVMPLVEAYVAALSTQETTIAELVAAGIALRDDLEMRAELNKRRNGGEIVVEASAGVWMKFCAALTKVRSAL